MSYTSYTDPALFGRHEHSVFVRGCKNTGRKLKIFVLNHHEKKNPNEKQQRELTKQSVFLVGINCSM
jgi:hypothetical protein